MSEQPTAKSRNSKKRLDRHFSARRSTNNWRLKQRRIVELSNQLDMQVAEAEERPKDSAERAIGLGMADQTREELRGISH